MENKTIPTMLLSLIILLSGCTITIDGGGDSAGTTSTTGSNAPVTSAYVSSVSILSMRDSTGASLYSGASTSDDLVTIAGRVVTTGTSGYSTAFVHNNIEQLVSVDSTGNFETVVSIVPGLNRFQIVVRDLQGQVIGRSIEYTISTTQVAGSQVVSQATDLRVILTWNVEDTDLDLHVTDPNDCETYYGDMAAIADAELDVDDVDGFGPEIFTLNSGKAVIGSYDIVIDYFSSHGNEGPVTATVRVQISEGNVQTFTHTFASGSDEDATWNVGSFSVASASIPVSGNCAGSESLTQSGAVTGLYITQVGDSYSSPSTVSSSSSVVTVQGYASFTGELDSNIILYVNNVPQYVRVSEDGEISESTILSSGTNILRLAAVNSAGEELVSSQTWTVTAASVTASDLVVVLTWDTDYDDMDLHVVGPTGIETYYGYTTTTDGELDIDDTEGYGPETFTLSSSAPAGVYHVFVNYYDNDGVTDADDAENSHLTVSIRKSGTVTTYTHTFTPADETLDWSVANITISR